MVIVPLLYKALPSYAAQTFEMITMPPLLETPAVLELAK